MLFLGAANVKAITIAEVQAQIKSLMAQLAEMQAQEQVASEQTKSWCHSFTNNLRIGDTGKEVNLLQIALEKNGLFLRGEGITFNEESAEFSEGLAFAVTAFQEKYASEILSPNKLTNGNGYFGPATRRKLNALYGCVALTMPKICPAGTTQVGESNSIPPSPICSPSAIPALECKKDLDCPIIACLLSPCFTNKCVDKKCTKEEVRPECNNMWWYDNSNRVCQQKQFCGSYMYFGLKTFEAQSDCTNSLNSVVPAITVISPNGGEIYRAGDNVNITWTSTFSGNVKLSITNPNGTLATFGTSTDNISRTILNTGSYIWSIPSDFPVGNYKINLALPIGSYAQDYSDNNFSIVAQTTRPSIAIASPNGGEIWKSGETHNITWRSTGLLPDARVVLNLDDGNGHAYSIMNGDALSVLASAGSYSWTVPQNTVGGYNFIGSKFKIFISTQTTNLSDSSDNYFSIVSPVVVSTSAITFPVSGSQLIKGNTYNITWTPSSSSARMYISLQTPTTLVSRIAEGIADTGSYSWTVPSNIELGSNYNISIRTGAYVPVATSSNFSIVSPTVQPSITVTSPNGGEVWQVGNTYQINWTNAGLDASLPVAIGLIDYSQPGGSSYGLVMNTDHPKIGDNRFSFVLDKNKIGQIIAGNKYKVQISVLKADGFTPMNVFDSSDNYFSIVSPVVAPTLNAIILEPSSTSAQRITAPNGSTATYKFIATGGDVEITEIKFNVNGSDSSASQTVSKICIGTLCAVPVVGIATFTGVSFIVPGGTTGSIKNFNVTYSAIGGGGVASGTTSSIGLASVKYTAQGTENYIFPNISAPTMTLISPTIVSSETCFAGQTRKYTCSNGNIVNWCSCNNSKWACAELPETQCNPSTATVILRCQTLAKTITDFVNLNGTVLSSSVKYRRDYDLDNSNSISSSDAFVVGYAAASLNVAACTIYLNSVTSYNSSDQYFSKVSQESQLASIADAIKRIAEEIRKMMGN
jgi:hypothetical protein